MTSHSDEEIAAQAAALEAVLDGPSLEDVAVACGVPVAEIQASVDAGRLQAVRMESADIVITLVPSWELGPDGRPLPGLGAVLAALPASAGSRVVDVVVWAGLPAPVLDGATPHRWLTGGRDLDVLTAYASTWVL